MADWIGSGIDISKNNLAESLFVQKVLYSLDNAGFIRPAIRKNLSFKDIFPPYSSSVLQQQMIESVKGPGIYILEAPMGLGKTEAALFAAYKALEENRTTGIYFAFPTQLTSNRMIERMGGLLLPSSPQVWKCFLATRSSLSPMAILFQQ